MNEQELLANGLRESRIATVIASELATHAAVLPEGLPLKEVRQSLAAWRRHLQDALCAVNGLENLAKQKP